LYRVEHFAEDFPSVYNLDDKHFNHTGTSLLNVTKTNGVEESSKDVVQELEDDAQTDEEIESIMQSPVLGYVPTSPIYSPTSPNYIDPSSSGLTKGQKETSKVQAGRKAPGVSSGVPSAAMLRISIQGRGVLKRNKMREFALILLKEDFGLNGYSLNAEPNGIVSTCFVDGTGKKTVFPYVFDLFEHASKATGQDILNDVKVNPDKFPSISGIPDSFFDKIDDSFFDDI